MICRSCINTGSWKRYQYFENDIARISAGKMVVGQSNDSEIPRDFIEENQSEESTLLMLVKW